MAADIWARSTLYAYIRSADVGGTYIESTRIRIVFIVMAYIRNAFEQEACVGSILRDVAFKQKDDMMIHSRVFAYYICKTMIRSFCLFFNIYINCVMSI